VVTVDRRSGCYVLELDPRLVDLFEFRRLVGSAREEASAEQRAARLSAAIDLWRGEPLDGVTGTWADLVRAGLTEQLTRTLLRCSQLELELDHHDLVVERLTPYVLAHPLVEPLIAVLMRALVLGGRAAEALTWYARTRQRLIEDLGTEPGPELSDVHRAILRGELRPAQALPQSNRASGRVPHQLPSDVSVFTGRLAELKLLDEVVEASGTVAITAVAGTAGVGKTALAVHWGHTNLARFTDGQLYVDLRGFDADQPMTPLEALGALLRSLGIDGKQLPPDLGERAALFRSELSDRRMLVVLDNAANTEQVRMLLPGGRASVAVVTSRDSLAELVARHGARRLGLDLLSTDEAVRLLSAVLGDRLGPDPEAAVALAQRCACLPLALRIAAEYLATHPHVTAAALARDLADEQHRLDLLDAGGGARTAMRSVLSWSYRALDPAAANLFQLLGLSPSADLDEYAIAALMEGDLARVRQLLDRLVRAHLLRETTPRRFGLHDLLRAYARELSAGMAEERRRAAWARLLDHYLSVSGQAMDKILPFERHRRPPVLPATGPMPTFADAAGAQSWLDANRTNLVDAQAMAADIGREEKVIGLSLVLARHFEMGGHYVEGAEVQRRALAAAAKRADRFAEAAARTQIANLHGRCGRFEEAIAEGHRALEICDEVGADVTACALLNQLGAFSWMVGRFPAAEALLERAIEVAERVGDKNSEATARANLTTLMKRLGRIDEALMYGKRSIELSMECGNQHGEAIALLNLGTVYLELRRLDEALACEQRALELLRRAGGRRAFEGRAMTNIVTIQRRRGFPAEALSIGEQALAVFRDIGDRDGEASVMDELGAVYQDLGRHEEAGRHHAHALDLAVATRDRSGEARALNHLGQLARSRGRPHEALTQHLAALSIATELGEPFVVAACHDGAAGAALDADGVDAARAHWTECLRIYLELGVRDTARIQHHLEMVSLKTALRLGSAYSPKP
jgi:tetratricopeptide (TPR) repeat protein